MINNVAYNQLSDFYFNTYWIQKTKKTDLLKTAFNFRARIALPGG